MTQYAPAHEPAPLSYRHVSLSLPANGSGPVPNIPWLNSIAKVGSEGAYSIGCNWGAGGGGHASFAIFIGTKHY